MLQLIESSLDSGWSKVRSSDGDQRELLAELNLSSEHSPRRAWRWK